MNSTVQKLNSLVPVGNILQNTKKTVVNAANSGYNAGIGAVKSVVNSRANSGSWFGSAKSVPSSVGVSGSGSSWNTPLVWFLGILLVFLVLFSYYYYSFMHAIQNWTDSLSMWYSGKGSPGTVLDDPPVVQASSTEDDAMKHSVGVEAVVEKILPPAKDVFTVSKNEFSYYDAAPLCKALGAELATYDQVKHAWQKGADWCNYGWVKGQMAVFPTQKSTYEELQQGPAEQRAVCGKPGLNGGYFDNPELKFGVTCVGKKPTQSQHDANEVASGATRPLSASGIEFDKKVQKFKEESESLGVLPFNKERWTS